jgi:hypothetical protein
MRGRRYNRFGRGGCFVCQDCGRRTRETAENAGLDGFCGLCAELAMLQNGISDNGDEYAVEAGYFKESRRLRREILRRGGKLNDGMTWAESNPLPLEEGA